MAGSPRPRRVPQRTCVGCRSVAAKRQLVRVVRAAEGQVHVDLTGKAAGRGAYVHDQRSCWEKALTSGALERALKVNLNAADRAALTAHGQQYSDETAR
ncbi:MAG: YlxR family protein [Anaerolineales bacterium]|nr:YlxR family protein [Anaerolineales bacterium]